MIVMAQIQGYNVTIGSYNRLIRQAKLLNCLSENKRGRS
jgi:hypothetical protein